MNGLPPTQDLRIEEISGDLRLVDFGGVTLHDDGSCIVDMAYPAQSAETCNDKRSFHVDG